MSADTALPPAPATFRPRNFTALWAGAAATNLADGIFKLTLPLLAVSLTSSPALVAGASLANTLPWLALALPAGAFADRVDRRRLMMVTTAVRVVLIALLVAAVLADALPLIGLYLAALLLGTNEVFADTTRMSVIQMVVPRHRTESAFAKLTGTETVANELAGPPLGGLLAGIGFALALGVSGLGYALTVVALAVMTGQFRSSRSTGATARPSVLSDIRGGLTYVWHERILRLLLLSAGGASACWAGWMAIIVVFAVAPGRLGLSESGFGLLMGALGVGGVLGAFAAPVLSRRLGRRVVLVGSMACFTVLIGTPAVSDTPVVIALATFVGGAGSGAWNVAYSSLRTLVVPDEMIGRYSGVSRLSSWGSMPLGAAAAGALAEFISVRAVFWVGGTMTAALVMLVLWTVSSPDFREIEARAETSVHPATA
ncbi:MFS transporter [Micromonospora peucetia]|nr:MFS transporter [Micromonospora peucetia]SCL46896.1 Predicted arabinose efflux permease, MFS family [Micromonospora peucetia]